MLTIFAIDGNGRRVVEQGSRDACLTYLSRTTGRRFQVEHDGERSPVLAPDAAERFVALFCR